jgi:hypothetical protein
VKKTVRGLGIIALSFCFNFQRATDYFCNVFEILIIQERSSASGPWQKPSLASASEDVAICESEASEHLPSVESFQDPVQVSERKLAGNELEAVGYGAS